MKTNFALSFLVLCCLAGASNPQLHAELKAGAATSVITPPIGIVINGGTAPVVSTDVHDELHARAIVLEDGATRLALVVVDNCLLPRSVCDAAKVRIQIKTQLAPSQVLISATHTHSAGSVATVHLSDADVSYVHWLPDRIADAVVRAIHRLAPAEIAWGRGALPQHVFCRRVTTRADVPYVNQMGDSPVRAKMNWDSPHPADGNPTGPVDPDLSLLAIRHLDGRPLALLANYSLHYVGDGVSGDLSADYFGVFCERMTSLLGAEKQDPPFVAVMSNGTSADINNNDYRNPKPATAPYTRIRQVAEDAAQEAMRVMKGMTYRSAAPLQVINEELTLGVRKPSIAEVERARVMVSDSAIRKTVWLNIRARDTVFLSEQPDTISVPLQVIGLGEWRIAAWPGEIFAVSGLRLKERVGAGTLFNVSLANGWFGYIPPPEQHELGAYETFRLRTSFLETNATVKLTDRLAEMVEKLRVR